MRYTRLFLTSVLLLLQAGCSGPQSTLNPAGPAARSISWLSWFIYITFIVVGLIMWGLLIWVAVRRRGTLAEHEPVDIGGGQEWILTGGFLIPLTILATIFVLGMTTLAAFPVHDRIEHEHPDIRVTAHQWWWQLDYLGGPPDQHFTSANEIHIPVGRPVDLELMSADVIHSFWVPRLHGKEDLIPGQPNLLRIQADQPGTFTGQCAEFCGAQHANMRLLVVAQREPEYEAWLAGQRATAAEPANDGQALGQQMFVGKACAFCHTIRGTDAHGKMGPDLTHLASRQAIASNMLPNNEGNLEGWFTHAQALKPGVEMPNMTQFTGTQARALAAYLQSLK